MIRPICSTLASVALCALCRPDAAAAQAVVPVPPATVARSSDGDTTVRAVRITEPLRLDGRLDEPAYTNTPPISDFIQQEPKEGEPTTEKTEAWIFFDDKNVYVSARCWDSHPEREIGNEMRRDAFGITQNEHFIVVFDTFHDKRNGMYFQANILGAQRDALITDENGQNQDWNTIWEVKTGRFDQGWTVEFAIPFKSLRYNSDAEQIWGVQFRRTIRWKNEMTYLAPVPAYLSQRGIWAVSLAADLIGLETPSSKINLELKPYGITGLRTDLNATPLFRNRLDRDVGVDAKYGITKSLTLDLTYNTDFAQVEDDTAQVNLTRFNLQFPERREFFLEGQGIFAFGGVQPSGGFGGGGGGGGGGSLGPNNANTPVLFFSRRIGLNHGRPIPIAGGGRLTGRVGPYSVGLLNIQAEETPPSNPTDVTTASRATNFSVVRVKRDILRRSNVGVLYTRRAETSAGRAPAAETFGLDSLFSLSPALNINGYYARTHDRNLKGHDDSHLVSFDYNADRYGLQIQRLKVGTNFVPQVGFLRRSDFRRSFVQARFSPRPQHRMKAVRRFIYLANVEYIENNPRPKERARLDWREQEAQFEVELLNSDRINIDYTRDFEFIPTQFEISKNVSVPVGGYTYNNLLTSYYFGNQRRMSGLVSFQEGQFYGGTKRTVGLAVGRAEMTPQFSLEPSVSINWVDLPYGSFATSVIAERTTFTFTPRMFVSALTQYSSSSHTFSTNARLRWEYRPASELFVVYSDGRDTLGRGYPALVNRAFIIKVTKLVRF